MFHSRRIPLFWWANDEPGPHTFEVFVRIVYYDEAERLRIDFEGSRRITDWFNIAAPDYAKFYAGIDSGVLDRIKRYKFMYTGIGYKYLSAGQLDLYTDLFFAHGGNKDAANEDLLNSDMRIDGERKAWTYAPTEIPSDILKWLFSLPGFGACADDVVPLNSLDETMFLSVILPSKGGEVL